MDPFLGQIIMFGGNFAPRGWALCDGQLLPIASYSALFSILGTTYGGDGRTTFQLPDLRGRVPVHAGNGTGLSTRRLGEKGGREAEVLTLQQIPSHNHGNTANGVTVSSEGKGVVKTNVAAGNFIGDTPDGFSATAGTGKLGGVGATDNSGGNGSHNNMQPYQVVNYIIALQGTFPSRS